MKKNLLLAFFALLLFAGAFAQTTDDKPTVVFEKI
jgi:hypothetical protein